MIIAACGISGSGKSTWVKQFLETHSDHEVICPDLIRKELTGSISDQSRNSDVWKEVYARLDFLNKNKVNVLFDSTLCNLATVKTLYKNYYPIKIKLFDCDPDVAACRVNADILNNVDRSAVPREVIQRQYEGYKIVKKWLIDNNKNILT